MQAPLDVCFIFFQVEGDIAARTAEGVGRSNDRRESDVFAKFICFLPGMGKAAARNFQPDFGHDIFEQVQEDGIVIFQATK